MAARADGGRIRTIRTRLHRRPQRLNTDVRQVQRAPRACRFRFAEHDLAVDPLNRPTRPKFTRGQVDVRPREPERFTAANTGRKVDQPQRAQSVLLGVLDQPAGVTRLHRGALVLVATANNVTSGTVPARTDSWYGSHGHHRSSSRSVRATGAPCPMKVPLRTLWPQ